MLFAAAVTLALAAVVAVALYAKAPAENLEVYGGGFYDVPHARLVPLSPLPSIVPADIRTTQVLGKSFANPFA